MELFSYLKTGKNIDSTVHKFRAPHKPRNVPEWVPVAEKPLFTYVKRRNFDWM
jgi:hypothetical protein